MSTYQEYKTDLKALNQRVDKILDGINKAFNRHYDELLRLARKNNYAELLKLTPYEIVADYLIFITGNFYLIILPKQNFIIDSGQLRAGINGRKFKSYLRKVYDMKISTERLRENLDIGEGNID